MPDKEHKVIIQQLIAYAQKKVPAKQSALILSFLEQYYVHAPLTDLKAHLICDLYGAAMSHWALMWHRAPGEYKRHIFNPNLETDGWESKHTILQFILDDQPFLVDTLCTEINRQGLTVHFIVHLGGIKIQRNTRHEITKILPYDTMVKGALSEAPIYAVIANAQLPAVFAFRFHVRSGELHRF